MRRNRFETTYRPDFIEMAVVHDLADYCATRNVQSVYLSGGGEPTIHTHVAGIIAASATAGIQTALITNGTRIKRIAEVAKHVPYIQVSLIGADRVSYAANSNREAFDLMRAVPRKV